MSVWNASMTAKVLYVPSCFFVGAKFMEDRYIGDVTGHDWIHVRIESEPSRDRERQETRLRMFRTWGPFLESPGNLTGSK